MVRPWPVLLLSDWIRVTFEDAHYGGYFLLGGHKLNRWEDAKQMLQTFWTRHSKVSGDMPEFPEATLPILIHGDEGRGQGKRPILVVGFQPVIPWAGEDVVNSTKYFGLCVGQCFFVQSAQSWL